MQDTDALLAEQVWYYRAAAAEYSVDEAAMHDLAIALAEFWPTGHALELACGPGLWTQRLLLHASTVTAVDAAPEMLALAKARVGEGRVRFVHANIFGWEPEDAYDFVFFGFWLSHVPLDRFDAFWALVRSCLKPDGRVFFIDDNALSPAELIYGHASSTIQRHLADGSTHRAVKVPHQPVELEERMMRLGWSIRVATIGGPFYYGAGTPRPFGTSVGQS